MSTQVIIDGHPFRLHGDQDVDDLMGRIEVAARSGPSFVHLDDGDSSVRVLVGSQSHVVITVHPDRPSGARTSADDEPLLVVDMVDWEL
ncbi:hypothetical protein ACIP5T_16090 [Microbacterium sp. NPDC088619]|uniref:hypothetical protein n=1 Tax=Microbacterium sp. NPDC088619 TaxID=3364196 RepID=UPI00382C9C90